MEERRAALRERQAALALELQQMDAQLGAEAPEAPQLEEEALCVVCMDAPKNHFIRPCMHMCTCEACTLQLQEQGAQSCPVCRGPIEGIERVFT